MFKILPTVHYRFCFFVLPWHVIICICGIHLFIFFFLFFSASYSIYRYYFGYPRTEHPLQPPPYPLFFDYKCGTCVYFIYIFIIMYAFIYKIHICIHTYIYIKYKRQRPTTTIVITVRRYFTSRNHYPHIRFHYPSIYTRSTSSPLLLLLLLS